MPLAMPERRTPLCDRKFADLFGGLDASRGVCESKDIDLGIACRKIAPGAEKGNMRPSTSFGFQVFPRRKPWCRRHSYSRSELRDVRLLAREMRLFFRSNPQSSPLFRTISSISVDGFEAEPVGGMAPDSPTLSIEIAKLGVDPVLEQ